MSSKLFSAFRYARPYIPFTEDRYHISFQGVVTDQVTREVLTPTFIDGELCLTITFTFDKYRVEKKTVSLALLLALTYKGCKVPHHLWDDIRFFYKGKGLNPSTIAYQPFDDRFNIIFNDTVFRIIPHFTQYAISQTGEVLDYNTEKLCRTYDQRCNGEVMGILKSDTGSKTTVALKRFIALAHCPYTDNIDSLRVNLIDATQPLTADNLKWVRAGRIAGKPARGIPVKTRDFTTGEIVEHINVSEAARYLGLHPTTLHTALRSGSSGLCSPHHHVAYLNSPWLSNTVTLADLGRLKLPRDTKIVI